MKNRQKLPQGTVILQGSEPIIPSHALPIRGVLVTRADEEVTAYWAGSEWVPVDHADWLSRFGTPIPAIPVGSWAVINRLKDRDNYRQDQLTADSFTWAFRFVEAEVFLRQQNLEVSDQQHVTERDEITQDVRDYVEECLGSLVTKT